MYDLNMDSPDRVKEYTKFHKWIIKRGYVMLQYSLYYKTINAITKYSYEEKALAKSIPSHGNVRCMLVSDRQFYDMKILRGDRYLNELVNNSERYVRIDEDLWE